ncbi:MAG: hypothetical protein PWQ96_1691 [Clostridia bacterium]|nr:hypothetical protein [Clostridiales bacterium]MDK2986048.1 hypothetical protein [Clostridia bacterium]
MKPVVYAGKPQNIDDFRQQEVDGINVYVPKDQQLKDDVISIDLKGIGPFKQLLVEGI